MVTERAGSQQPGELLCHIVYGPQHDGSLSQLVEEVLGEKCRASERAATLQPARLSGSVICTRGRSSLNDRCDIRVRRKAKMGVPHLSLRLWQSDCAEFDDLQLSGVEAQLSHREGLLYHSIRRLYYMRRSLLDSARKSQLGLAGQVNPRKGFLSPRPHHVWSAHRQESRGATRFVRIRD